MLQHTHGSVNFNKSSDRFHSRTALDLVEMIIIGNFFLLGTSLVLDPRFLFVVPSVFLGLPLSIAFVAFMRPPFFPSRELVGDFTLEINVVTDALHSEYCQSLNKKLD